MHKFFPVQKETENLLFALTKSYKVLTNAFLLIFGLGTRIPTTKSPLSLNCTNNGLLKRVHYTMLISIMGD